MNVLETITAAGQRTNKPTGNSDVKARFLNHLNFARRKAWNKFNWSWKNKIWLFPVVDQIITGTASVTNGSRTVTLSAASVGQAQVGWYFQVYGITPASWYRVLAVSGQVLTLDPAFQGSTNATASFYLRGFDWPIPSELEGMPTAVEMGTQPIELHSMQTRPTLIPDTRGKPTRGIIWSDDPIGTTYTTGNLASTVNTRTWTGSNTLWLTGTNAPVPGDQLEITIGSTTYKYHVQSVQSDTQLTTYQYNTITVSGQAYTLRNQFNRYIRLASTPDSAYVMGIYGQRRFYPLINDNDVDELLQNFDECFVEGMEAYEAASTPDDRENSKYNKFLISIAEKIGIDERNFTVVQPAPINLPYGAYRA